MVKILAVLFLVMTSLVGCGGGGGGGGGPELLSIEVLPAANILAIGTNKEFKATGTYSDGTKQVITTSVTWSSSDISIATIAANGMVSTVAAGQTTISATLGGVSGFATLEVQRISLKSIAISPSSQTMATGTTQQLTATGSYTDNTTQVLTQEEVTWSSLDPSIANIDPSGIVTAGAAGITTITAAFGGKSGTATLTVATLQSISVTPTNPSLAVGSGLQFKAEGKFLDNTTQDLTTQVDWSSSDISKATIDQNTGKATAGAAGTTTITADFGGILQGMTTLTVSAATLQSITVTPANPSLAAGTFQQFSATGTLTDSTPTPLTTEVTWSSSDPSKASIESNGLVRALSAGPTTITATVPGVMAGETMLTVTPAAVAGVWIGTYTIDNAIDIAEIGKTYTYKFVFEQTGAAISGISEAFLRYDIPGQAAKGPFAAAGDVSGRELKLTFTYIDPRYNREMEDIVTATISGETGNIMTGSATENYNKGFNASYSFELTKQ